MGYSAADPAGRNRGVVFRTASRAACDEAATVLDSVGIDSDVFSLEGDFLLVVRPEDVGTAGEQLHFYTVENSKEVENQTLRENISKEWPGALLYALVLMAVNNLALFNIIDEGMIAAGSAAAGPMREGEWWRAVTALTLHVDSMHLAGNMAFGALFGLFISRHLGAGLAWLSILLAGAAGNMASAFIHTPEHTAVGASTAVFAALGLQSAYAWRTRHRLIRRGIRRRAPIIGGVLLLVFLGGSGARVDVVSHVTGFLSGILLGAVFGTWGSRLIFKTRIQIIAGAASITIIVLAWLAALRA